MVVEMLKASGHRVDELDPKTGKQWKFQSHGGHHKANLDGFIVPLGSPNNEAMTLEVKSMNKGMFRAFRTKGVQLSHPHYYDQVQDGLMLVRGSGWLVNHCFLIAYCKDNSEFHVEIVPSNPDRQIELDDKVDALCIDMDATRIGGYKQEYACSQCFKNKSCWEPDLTGVEKHCSHCRFSFPITNGDEAWGCSVFPNMLSVSVPCSSFQLFRPERKP